jgi:pyruvate/2-oxoglutarate dehydrogenase complex dihydrolipoamide dehydrogenase (E3) component
MPDGVNSYLAAEVKKNVSTPVATVGAFTEPELMEEIIATGKADVVDVARGLIADPDLPNKARQGRAEDITRCLRCFTCFSYILTNELLCCAVNPEIGQELESRFEAPPAKSSKKVLIAGGGIGGMQAALTAVERGHKVILCEKTDELGGVLRCEREVPFKEKLDGYLDLQARRVKEAGVDIRLNTEVTAEYAAAEEADVVIAAMGARPIKPPIPGIDGANVISAEDAYVHPEKTGDKVVMLGAGFVGTELGLYLRGMGKEITVIEMMPGITDGGNILHGLAVDVRMKEVGVETRFNTKAVEISDAGVLTENVVTGESVLYEADTVIYAVGQRALGEESDVLLAAAPEFYKIGDCVTPKNIREATKAGHYAAKNIASI